MSRFLIGFLALCVLGGQGIPAGDPAAETPSSVETGVTVLYLLRHAETEPPPYKESPPNPNLTHAGRARAKDLARLLATARINRILSSDYRRTRAAGERLAGFYEARGRDDEAQKYRNSDEN